MLNKMNSNPDIRWIQRFENYKRAFDKLSDSVVYIRDHMSDDLNASSIQDELFKQGLIQSFEFTHELAWNVMKDYALFQGEHTVRGSRDATRAAFEMGLIEDGEVWMEMIKSKNATSHTYDEATSQKIFLAIIYQYLEAFRSFYVKMEQIKTESSQSGFF